MALDYTSSAELMKDAVFVGRVKVACLKYATYIIDQGPTASQNAMKWAKDTMVMPDSSAGTVTPPTVLDAAVQEAGAAITDQALQNAVEGVVNKVLA